MTRNFNILLGSFLTASLLSACGGDKPDNKQNAPIPVTLEAVQEGTAIYYEQYPGTINALSQVDLRAEVGGYITGIYFKEGQHVKKGQKLYEIDRSKYAATYAQANAAVQVAKANESRLQKDLDRYNYLNKQDAIAKQTLDHAQTDLDNARSQVASANADLVKAQTDLRYSVISAPFDGTIGLSQVKMGTLLSAGQTLLNTISTNNPIAVDFVINEKYVNHFQQLQNQAKATDSLFTILLPDNSLYGHVGKLSVIDRAVDPQTGTIKVRLEFPNENDALRAGMSCMVRVHNQEGEQQIIIPSKAITEQMGEYFVFVAKDTNINGPAMVAQQKKVMMGQTIGSNTVIKDGVSTGERLVVEGIQKLRNGAQINAGGKPAGK